MANHPDLKPSDAEIPLLLAGSALSRVDDLANRPSGVASYDNADGTRTVVGGTGGATGVTGQVGKTDPPGTPSGLTLSSVGLAVTLDWDGTFVNEQGGACTVRATLTDDSGANIDMGVLSEAGSLTVMATVPGPATVTVTAYDDAHADDGAAQPNASQTVTLETVLSELVDTDAIEQTVDDADKQLSQNADDIAAAQATLAQAQKDLQANKDTIAQAQKDIASNLQTLKQAQSDIQANRQTIAQAENDVKTAQSQADNAVQAAQSAQAGVSKAQSTADSAMTDAAAASKTASDAATLAGDANTTASQAASAASKAQDTANSASAKADSANTAAGKAQQSADAAQTTAEQAAQNAGTALLNANSALARAKNITVSGTAPTSPATGDIWYPLDSNQHVAGMKTWDGVEWTDVTIIAGKILVPGSVGATEIADGAITTPKIQAGAVDADRLAAGSVQAGKIASGAVSADSIAAGAVTADKLAANSVAAAKIVANAITGDKIAGNTISGSKLIANTITGDKIAANAIDASKLAANSVTADKLAANSVDASKIMANSIGASKLTLSAGNLFSNPTFAGDASPYGTTDRVDNVTFPDGSTGSTAAMRMDVTGMNPYVADSEWIPCNRGDVFYVGVWLSYADDSYAVPQGGTLNFGLDTRGDSSESWPNNGAQGLSIDMSEIPFNSGTGDKWKYFHTYATCPVTGWTRFWINAHFTSNGFHLLVWRPTVIRAADAKLIVNGSITADKIAAQSITGDKLNVGSVASTIMTSNQFKTSGTSDYTIVNDSGVTVYKGGTPYAHLGSDTTYGLQTWNPFSNSMTDVSLMSFGAASIVETNDVITETVRVAPHRNSWTPWKDLDVIQENGSWKRFRSPSGRFFVALVMGYKGTPANDFVYLCGNINFRKNNGAISTFNDYPSTHAIPGAGLAAAVFTPTPFVGLVTVEPNVDYAINFSFRSAHMNTGNHDIYAYGHCNYRRLFIMPV